MIARSAATTCPNHVRRSGRKWVRKQSAHLSTFHQGGACHHRKQNHRKEIGCQEKRGKTGSKYCGKIWFDIFGQAGPTPPWRWLGGCLLIFFEVCLLRVELLNTYLVTLIKYHFFKKKHKTSTTNTQNNGTRWFRLLKFL